MKFLRYLMVLGLCVGLAVPAIAQNISGDGGGSLYSYREQICLQDDFLSGSTGNGLYGSLGWIAAGGSTSLIQSESGRPGILRKDTSSSSGTVAYLGLSNTNASQTIPAGSFDLMWLVRLNQKDANTSVRIGTQNTTTANPPNEGTFFEALDADSNWFAVTRASSTQTGTRTDTGVPVAVAWVTLRIVRNESASISYYLNDVLVAVHSSNIPSVPTNPVVMIVNSAAASKTVDADYFQICLTGLSR